MITGKTKLLGVIGYPIEHSFSPIMHNAAIAAMGVDYVYLPFPIAPENLTAAIAGFNAIGLQGFSITIPHKQTIIPLLGEISPVAQAVGAVNTVIRTETGWRGTNTDIDGFLSPLKGKNWQDSVAVILGAGGAARAVVAGCLQLKCREIHVVGRNVAKLVAFAESWRQATIPVQLAVHPWESLSTLIPQAGLIVNTTPVGMFPHIDQSPVDETVLDQLSPGTFVYDLIYTPNPTLLLQHSQDRGAIILDGLEMLVQQGAKALELWLNRQVPASVMRQALEKHLGM